MTAVLAILALIFVLFVAAGIFVTVKAVSAAKRGVDRTVAQARRTVEDTALRARQYAQPGLTGELAQLRLSLRTSMRATQETLRAASAEDPSLSEAVRLFGRLSAHGQELEDELKRLEREPDRARIAQRLPELRERLERITHSAESLRWAARDRARKFAEDDLAALAPQIDVEAGALRHWAPGPEADAAAAGAAGAGAADPLAAWPPPEGGATGGRTPDGAPADASGATPGERSAPQALTARDPHARTTYPWQKTARPESAG